MILNNVVNVILKGKDYKDIVNLENLVVGGS